MAQHASFILRVSRRTKEQGISGHEQFYRLMNRGEGTWPTSKVAGGGEFGPVDRRTIVCTAKCD